VESLELRLLGRFEVSVDGVLVPEAAWAYGRAKDLVKLLAISPGRRLSRDEVVELLWPSLDAEAGFANLHKAAHHARRALGDRSAVVLREGAVMLAPGARVESDLDRFEATRDPDRYGGDLLPDDRYAEWAEARREELREAYLKALREAHRWERLAAEDPADEVAQLAVMRGRWAAGDRVGAQAAFDRLCSALAELGLRPGAETTALTARITGGAALDQALATVDLALADAPVAERARLLATRADLLLTLGDRGAPAAFAQAAAAMGTEGVPLRVRQAWAQLALGDPRAAQATLDALQPRSDAERASLLIARAAAAWYGGDPVTSLAAADEARPLALAAGLEREARTAVQIQAMVAHSVGSWPEALNRTLDESLRAPDLAETLFDGHLCVAQFALTSGESHERLREVAADLHLWALREGARRAQTLSATMLGEISLIAGRLDEADDLLREAVRVSRDLGAITAEALATLRLGEVERAQSRTESADALISDAVLISAWSPLSEHIQPLAYAGLLRATDDPELGRARLDDAEAAMRGALICSYCGMAFRVAGSVAAARAGLPDRAADLLAAAEQTAVLWRAGPWPAALDEARGELMLARGDVDGGRASLGAAHDMFGLQGRPVDAQRVATRLSSLR
jgi:DNA-binding SARP family transcriptional activator